MKSGHALLVTAFLASATANGTVAIAQNCSGGPDGGADATGNQCAVATSAATEVDPAIWTLISSHLVAPRPHDEAGAGSPVVTGGATPVSAPDRFPPGAGDIDSSRWARR